jgi:transposase
MDTLVVKPAYRKQRRHSEEFKQQVIAACMQPGVSVAAIALANGLNANYLRRWVRAHREEVEQSKILIEGGESEAPAMLPVTITANAPPLEIRLDVRRSGTTVQMAWPLEAADRLGQCLRELLR